jgi:carboxymethylenebutenolidase
MKSWGWGVAAALMLTACFPRQSLVLPRGVLQQAVVEEHASYERRGRDIQVDVYRPALDHRHETVLLLHGSSGIHDLGPQQVTRFGRTLASLGLTALVVHYFDGTGHFTASAEDEHAYYWEWVQDIRAGISWADSLPYANPRRISLLGISLGAWLSVGVASTDARVHGVVLIGSGLEPSARDSLRHMPPALLLHGHDDDVVPLANADTLAAALHRARRQVQLHVYPGQEHTLDDSASTDALLRAVRFLRRTHPASAAAAPPTSRVRSQRADRS